MLKDGEHPAKHCIRVVHFLSNFIYGNGDMNRTSKFDLSFTVLGIDHLSHSAIQDYWKYRKIVRRIRKHIGIITASEPSGKPRVLVMLRT